MWTNFLVGVLTWFLSFSLFLESGLRSAFFSRIAEALGFNLGYKS
jgi:hypothetical protein